MGFKKHKKHLNHVFVKPLKFHTMTALQQKVRVSTDTVYGLRTVAHRCIFKRTEKVMYDYIYLAVGFGSILKGFWFFFF